MVLKTLVDALDLTAAAAPKSLDKPVKGVYVSDLLSDVIAHASEGEVWITLQTHPNIVAVAVLKDLAGIILINNRQPEAETLAKAEQEGIPIMTTGKPAFQIAGKLYRMMGEG